MPETCSLNWCKTWGRFDQFDGEPTNRSPCSAAFVCKPRRLSQNAPASGKSDFRSLLYYDRRDCFCSSWRFATASPFSIFSANAAASVSGSMSVIQTNRHESGPLANTWNDAL